MKKIISALLIIIFLFTTASCGDPSSGEAPVDFSELEKVKDEAGLVPSPAPTPSPTPTPGTTVLSGYGDDVIEIDDIKGYVFHIKGNSSSRYFGVIAYDSYGNRIDALVNTTDVYDGVVIDPTFKAHTFEILCTCEWSIELIPIADLAKMNRPSIVSGHGDSVVILNRVGNTATISGNDSSRYFGVISYDKYGNRIDAIVNTTDVYSGTVLLRGNPAILQIIAEDNWTITFN